MSIVARVARGSIAVAVAGVLVVGGSSAAHAADFSLIDAQPTDTISTVNGDVVVTTALGPAAEFNIAYAGTGYFATNASGIELSYVDWTFSQPVYQVTVYYFAVESPLNGSSGDPQQFSTNLGPVDLALVADGGNRLSSTGFLNGTTQPEGTYAGDTVSCTSEDPTACSGTIELSFPEGITSFRSFNGGLVDSGFNGTGLALATDVPDPVQQPEVDGEELAQTGFGEVGFAVAGAALALVIGVGLVFARRERTRRA